MDFGEYDVLVDHIDAIEEENDELYRKLDCAEKALDHVLGVLAWLLSDE